MTTMYAARILSNETCNQRCAFCEARRPFERRVVAEARSVLARVDEALERGAREIAFTGGEPTLRKDLPALVAHAKRAGAERCLVETNAALIGPEHARILRRAGLTAARVHLPAWGDACDEITQDPGGFVRTEAGLRALTDAGLGLEISAPIVRSTLTTVPALPRALAESGLPIRVLWLTIPVRAPEPASLATLEEVVACVVAVQAEAQVARIRVRIDPAASVPPCVFPKPHRVAHLYSLTAGGADVPDHVRVPACEGCVVRPQCPGFTPAARERARALELQPVTEERTRRKLSMVSSVEEQVARELVTRDVRRARSGETMRENIVRINFHCNQACAFCFVSTHLPPAEEAAIDAAIREIAELRGVLTLSGGEPTLNPRLFDYVRRARSLGVASVELQTNAIRFAGDPAFARAAAEAGIDVAFVSLHAATARTSDAITGAPGTFERTVAGLDELARTDLEVRLNFVFCESNRAEFPSYVEMVASRWPRARITVSFVAPSTDVVPRNKEMIPALSAVLPHLAEGIRTARRLGVVLAGFESMCGIPLCLVPDDLTSFFTLAEAPPDGGEFVKAEACGRCALGRQCFGVRRGYAALHGTSELRAV